MGSCSYKGLQGSDFFKHRSVYRILLDANIPTSTHNHLRWFQSRTSKSDRAATTTEVAGSRRGNA